MSNFFRKTGDNKDEGSNSEVPYLEGNSIQEDSKDSSFEVMKERFLKVHRLEDLLPLYLEEKYRGSLIDADYMLGGYRIKYSLWEDGKSRRYNTVLTFEDLRDYSKELSEKLGVSNFGIHCDLPHAEDLRKAASSRSISRISKKIKRKAYEGKCRVKVHLDENIGLEDFLEGLKQRGFTVLDGNKEKDVAYIISWT